MELYRTEHNFIQICTKYIIYITHIYNNACVYKYIFKGTPIAAQPPLSND